MCTHVAADLGLQYTAPPLAQRRLDKSLLVQSAFVGTKRHALLACQFFERCFYICVGSDRKYRDTYLSSLLPGQTSRVNKSL